MPQNSYYRTPNEYTYVHGYGFTPPPPQVSEKRTIRLYANAIGLAIICMYLLQIILPNILFSGIELVSSILGYSSSYYLFPIAIYDIMDAITYTVALLLPFGLYCVFLKVPTETALPLRAPNMKVAVPAVMVAMGVSVIGSFSANMVSGFMYSIGIYTGVPDIGVPFGAMEILFYFINFAVLPALVEEFVFRGAIMQSLRRFGDTFALFASTILFAAIHGNLVQAPYAFFLGLVIGYFVLRTGSLWTGVLIHFVNNMLTLLMSYLPDNIYVLTAYILDAVFIILAVLAVMYLEKHDGDIFRLKDSTTVSLENHKFLFFFGAASMVVALVLILMLTLNTLQVM